MLGCLLRCLNATRATVAQRTCSTRFTVFASGHSILSVNISDDATESPLPATLQRHLYPTNNLLPKSVFVSSTPIRGEATRARWKYTYLFDSWFAYDSELIKHVESYGKDWIDLFRSNQQVTYANEEMRVDALGERIDKEERRIDEETYKIWTKTLPVSKLGKVRLAIAENVTDEDEENPVKYLATNKIDPPSTQIIRSYSYRWRIETFFEDSKQEIGLRDCEVRDPEGASGDWHLQMLTYSLLRLGSESSVSERLVSKLRRSEHSSHTASKRRSTTHSRECATSRTVTSTD